MADPAPDPRVGVVVITRDRCGEAARCLDRLLALRERPPVVVVDDGSRDGTAAMLAQRSAVEPALDVVTLPESRGTAGRTVGVERLDTPFVAFCDDDTWWEPGSLRTASDVLAAHPGLAVVTARIVVEPGGEEDPIVAELRDSPVAGPAWLPGPALGSFLAGASVLRRDAFLGIGGFEPRLRTGGEEELAAADLAAAGWELCYLPELLVHHQPSPARDPRRRRIDGLRNTLWFTWLRRPLPAALRRTVFLARTVPRDRASLAAAVEALAGLPWVLRNRRPLPPSAEARFAALERDQSASRARRYVG